MKKKFLICCFSIGLTLTLSELGVRFFIEPRSSGISTGALSNSWFEKHVAYNSQGFRDSEFESKNQENSVIMVGDSFTFGQGIRQEDTFFSLTKSLITEKEF